MLMQGLDSLIFLLISCPDLQSSVRLAWLAIYTLVSVCEVSDEGGNKFETETFFLAFFNQDIVTCVSEVYFFPVSGKNNTPDTL